MDAYSAEALSQLDVDKLRYFISVAEVVLLEKTRGRSDSEFKALFDTQAVPGSEEVPFKPVKSVKKYQNICRTCRAVFSCNNAKLKYCDECYGLTPIKTCTVCKTAFKSANPKELLCYKCYEKKLAK